ncbi:MAG: phosphoribosyltransferase family protein [Patescibacteria group bacterium]
MLTLEEIKAIFSEANAIDTNGHFVYTSDKHGRAYVNKDAVYPYTRKVSLLCKALAHQFQGLGVEVVVGPEKGGIILSQWVAYHLSEMENREVLGVYLERQEISLFKATEDQLFYWSTEVGSKVQEETRLAKSDELFVRRPGFEAKRNYNKLVEAKKVLGVEDIITTGGSAKRTIEAIRALGGEVLGLGVLCNRGGKTAEDVGDPPQFVSLLNVKMDAWEPDECPMCKEGVRINTDVGKGKSYVARFGQPHIQAE